MSESPTPADIPDWLEPAVARLLEQAGRGAASGLNELMGGANNRVFRVTLDDGEAVLKWYFTDPQDERDRLRSEWDFVNFAWQNGLRQIPQPLVCDPEHHLGLYESIAGRALLEDEIAAEHVEAAVEFCRDLNRFRHTDRARQLGPAAEACFSLEDHLRCINRRVERVSESVTRGIPLPAAKELVAERLSPFWREVRQRIRRDAGHWDLDLRAELPAASRILSPSDFGFHNALVDADGKLRFYDFEYAGWDDPAKTICDFFRQIAVPVPAQFLAPFTRSLLAGLPDPSRLERRVALLMPAYRVKWCCIILNPLLEVGQRRRAFSRAAEAPDEWLGQAHRILENP